MEKQIIDLVKKCAAISPAFTLYDEGLAPSDGMGIFLFDKMENDFTGHSQMGELWEKTYFPILIDSTIQAINKAVPTHLTKLHFVIFWNKISILDQDFSYLFTASNNEDGLGISTKLSALNEYFKILEDE